MSESLPVTEISSDSPALSFRVLKTWNKARRSIIQLPHGRCDTPMFMPVGTQGTIKGLTSEQIESVGPDGPSIILGNTYFLSLRPGADKVAALGGVHEMMNWRRNILTDSGGFQMVSLLDLAEFSEEGVRFTSPVDGTSMLLSPEKSIGLQNQIGSDIMMALDDVVSSTTTGPRVEEAMERTVRWLDRCLAAHSRPSEQNLFAIVQGGLDADLRRRCVAEFLKRDAQIPGYAIGGLSGGEDKNHFWRVVHLCTDLLPPNKPRYVMGVGYPLDLVVCVALGADMFDCVYPCRTARFGTALADVPGGVVPLRSDRYARVEGPIDPGCPCRVCTEYSCARLHQLACREGGAELLTIHNIAYQMHLMRRVRDAITDGSFPSFVQRFVATLYPEGTCPGWARDALAAVGIDV
eukprot:gnl/Trimastix_PCT/2135.p1 GENE.gnl/Trimastix_PCT/2135~~gnl/Trimastix_PCT/2135.p1  ORF type:complete len:407 (+),score=99.78 gnl/Trimastix_PCT/2135:41-1261(+)